MTDNSTSNTKLFGWLLIPLSLFPLVALLTYDWRAISALCTPSVPSSNWIGALGDGFAYYGYQLFGLAIWAILVLCIFGAIGLLFFHFRPGKRTFWFLLFLLSVACQMQVVAKHAPGIKTLRDRINFSDAGGVFGHLIMDRFLSPLLSDFGASVIVMSVMVLSFIAFIGLRNLCHFFVTVIKWALARPEKTPEQIEAENKREADRAAELRRIQMAKEAAKREAEAERQRKKEEKAAAKAAVKAKPSVTKPTPESAPEEPELDRGPYVLPPVSLLNPLKKAVADHSDVEAMSHKLIDTLKLFNVDATLSYTVKGPVVTKYALLLSPGTRYSTVTALEDNLKGALRAKSIRIEAPIPGEECIGIEVPNLKPVGISFREVFESDAWKTFHAELPLLFGKDAAGKELIADLATMPHMLVAGATGQGKSVCLNSLINGLLMTRTPEQLKLIMVDPKSVEFTPYAAIPHLLVPVITDNRKVVFSLKWAVTEMEKRLKMFARAHVKNIYDFNRRKTFSQPDMFGGETTGASDMPRTVPYIVIIIDEVADLMAAAAKEVVPDISRLTAKARAAGIHLILATQRPDAKVITGTIKANIPGRVAFKTAQGIDSRTILDDTGAENLIGKGDMLFKGKDGLLTRAQGAWISDEEIQNITAFIERHATVQFDETFATKLGRVKEAAIDDPFASNEDDPDNQAPTGESSATTRELIKEAAATDDFKKAVECVIQTKRASTSHFQRQLGWGYNHAARILDMLTERGIVSAPQGMGPRQIIMDQDQLVAILNGAPTETATPQQPLVESTDEQIITEEEL